MRRENGIGLAPRSAIPQSPGRCRRRLTLRGLRVALLAAVVLLWSGAAASVRAAPVEATDAGLVPLLMQKLRDRINVIAQRVDGVFGAAIIDLQTGQRLTWNPDAVFPVASAIKVPLLIELLRQSQSTASGTASAAGRARLDELYTPRREDLIPDSNILAGLSLGVSRLTNQDLATFMVVVSDNSATNILIDRVGMMSVNSLLDRLGLTRTRLRRKMLDSAAVRRGLENTSTPAELARLWELLYRGQVLDAEHTSLALRLLSLRKADYLSAQLPDSDDTGVELQVASKPGTLTGARTDAGIVWAGQNRERPFVVSVMVTYAHDGPAAESAIAEVTAAAYSCFSRLADSTSYGRRRP